MKNKRVLMVNVVRDAVACLGNDYRVEKIKRVRSIRIYFNSHFCSECLLSIFMRINGLYVIGVNCDKRFILVTY